MNSFDTVAETYRNQVGKAVAFSGHGFEYFVGRKVEHLKQHVHLYFEKTQGLRSVDIGAGEGQYSTGLHSLGFGTAVVDQSVAFLKVARSAGCPAACLASDATRLPLAPSTQDLVVMAMVLHHIPIASWPSVLVEVSRVLRPGGMIAVYEHNPWNPLTRRVMASLPFDKDANPTSKPVLKRFLRNAGFRVWREDYLFFIPAFASILLPVERLLTWCPLGAQYALLATKPQT